MGQDVSHIDSAEIQKMLHRFGKLDEDKSGALSAREFMQIPELVSNPLVERVIDIFDSDGNGEVLSRFDRSARLDGLLRSISPSFFAVRLVVSPLRTFVEISSNRNEQFRFEKRPAA